VRLGRVFLLVYPCAERYEKDMRARARGQVATRFAPARWTALLFVHYAPQSGILQSGVQAELARPPPATFATVPPTKGRDSEVFDPIFRLLDIAHTVTNKSGTMPKTDTTTAAHQSHHPERCVEHQTHKNEGAELLRSTSLEPCIFWAPGDESVGNVSFLHPASHAPPHRTGHATHTPTPVQSNGLTLLVHSA